MGTIDNPIPPALPPDQPDLSIWFDWQTGDRALKTPSGRLRNLNQIRLVLLDALEDIETQIRAARLAQMQAQARANQTVFNQLRHPRP